MAIADMTRDSAPQYGRSGRSWISIAGRRSRRM